MATAEKLAEAFDDLGFELEAGKVSDRLTALCGLHGLDEDKISCEYLAFLSRKKLAINRAPDLDLLDDFDRDLTKHLASLTEQKAAITKATGKGWADEDGGDDEDDANDLEGEDMSGFYGGGTPTANRKKRPLSSPPEESVKKRLSSSNTQDMDQTFSPSSYAGSQLGAGKTYAARTNAGNVMIRFGDDVPSSGGKWTNTSPFQVDLKVVSNSHPRDYRYMFERLRERAGHLDETICSIGDVLTEKCRLEPQDFCLASPQTFDAIGRVCCDSDGRLNAKSLVLQGNQDVVRGRSLPMDPSQVPSYSLFPGQVVGVKATNPTGSRLVATHIFSDAAPAPASNKKRLRTELQIVVASGPYTTSDNFSYEPLQDLLAYVSKNNPHLLVLCGPFVDAKHPKLETCETTFESLFANCMKMVAEGVQDSETTVLVLPSAGRDVHHTFIYPAPPFPESKTTNKIKMVSDPCVVDVEGLTLGITATDILFHLGKEEISFPPRSGDRLRRLAGHLLQQRSFYPLYPPNEEINLDMEQVESIGGASLDIRPDVMILPSDLLHFFKDIDGTLAMNPQRLSRGEGGGVFARLKVVPAEKETDTKKFSVSAEIVRI